MYRYKIKYVKGIFFKKKKSNIIKIKDCVPEDDEPALETYIHRERERANGPKN